MSEDYRLSFRRAEEDECVKNRPLFLDLFAGAGGLSEGFIQAGFLPVAHVESSQAACFTLKTRASYHWLKSQSNQDLYYGYLRGEITRSNFYSEIPNEIIESVICEEIGEKSLKSIFSSIDSRLKGRKLDLIVGGPPCQAYSLVGRSRDKNRMLGDQRNYLYKFYSLFLAKYKPKLFVFENVTGLLSAKDKNGNLYLDDMIALFRNAGYITEYKILSAEMYGVPQARKRVILIGRRGSRTNFYPELKKENVFETVNEVFSCLPAIIAGEGDFRVCGESLAKSAWMRKTGMGDDRTPITLHKARPHTKRDLEIYKIAVSLWNTEKTRLRYDKLPDELKTHNNRTSFLDRYKVVAGDLSHSHTIVAHIAKDGHYYIHPDIEQNRSLTPREAARLQTFPDNYYFESASDAPSQTAPFIQIGNAVPVALSRKIAEGLRSLL